MSVPGSSAIAHASTKTSNRGAAVIDQEVSSVTTVLRMKLVGANSQAHVVGERELPGKSNYFSGRDPKQWRTNIPNYERVRYQEVYPGVDLVYHVDQQRMEYDFVISPKADPRVIRLEIAGADNLEIDAQGDLLLKVGGSQL